MRALVFFMMAFTIEAETVAVSYGLKNFKIDYDNEQVRYTATGVNLSLQKKSCNEHIIKSFNIQMKEMLKGEFYKNSSTQTFSIKEDGVEKYDSKLSQRGRFFLAFHDYFEQLKIEESLSCQK